MAESAADSTKSEDDSSEVADTKVSSSVNNSHSLYSSAQGTSSHDNGHVSSSDAREPTQSMIQPSKFSGGAQGFWAFGSAHNPAVYSNPFVPRAPLKTDIVSTASTTGEERESIIAPSRLSAAVNRDSVEGSQSSYLRPSLLSASRLGGGHGFGSVGSSRQDLLSSTSSSGNSFHIRSTVFSAPILKPAKLPDPTKTGEGKVDVATEGDTSSAQEKACETSTVSERLEGADGVVGGNEVSSSSSTSSISSPHQTQQEPEGATAADASSYNHDIVADISKNNRLKDSSGVSSSSQSDFVFGKNLSQRVTGVISPSDNLGEASAQSDFVFGDSLSSRPVTEANGSSESSHKDDSDSDSGKLNRTLEESAREYQAKHENKTELKEVKRVTGEEEESNVLQANAKLFLFDASTQSWVERGRGVIRLNDMSSEDTRSFKSRLVMRTQGSLRVVLNTKIWPAMTIERASVKSVRITAMDTDETIKVFLIMTNTKDSENLLRAIDWRIQQLKIQEEPSRTHSDLRTGDKRKAESDFEFPHKSKKLNSPSECGTFTQKKDESDSSVQDPETEASCESHSSSLTIKSESD